LVTLQKILLEFLKVIEKYGLSNRRYKEMKCVANMLLDYAVENRFVSMNVSRFVHEISDKSLQNHRRKK
jgi:hypothetical protein